MITLSCPHCGHQMNIDDKYAGQNGTCGQCKKTITVPALKAAPPQEAEFAGFSVMHDDHTQPKYSSPTKKDVVKPGIPVKKDDRAPKEISWGFLAILGAILLVGGGVVLVSFVYANLNDIDREPEVVGQSDYQQPLAGKSIAEAISYISAYKQIKWHEIDGNNVYVGWDFALSPENKRMYSRTGENMANLASMAATGEVTFYVVDAAVAQQGWRPGGPGLKFQVGSLQGEVTTRQTF